MSDYNQFLKAKFVEFINKYSWVGDINDLIGLNGLTRDTIERVSTCGDYTMDEFLDVCRAVEVSVEFKPYKKPD